MKKFFVGFWNGLGKILATKIIGPVQVSDLWIAFCIFHGLYIQGKAAFGGYILATVFYIFYRATEELSKTERAAVKESLDALKTASSAMELATQTIEAQRETIKAPHEENEVLQSKNELLKGAGQTT